MAAYKIMIVEDDKVIGRLLAEHLNRWGYEAFLCPALDRVMEEFNREKPHLIFLDITLPFYSGYHWLEQIRKISTAPVIFISSNTGPMDIVMAMSMGGDDFITKPFDLNVALAKAQALLRRTYDFKTGEDTLARGDVVLNAGESALYARGRRIELTRNECRILKVLLAHPGETVSRETLMNALWDSDWFVDDNTLTVNVARLRKHLEDAGLSDFIHTKKGQGYLVSREE